VVDEARVDGIVEAVREVLKGERYTIIEVPIRKIIVNYGNGDKPGK
jgi:nitrogen regulatory protein PII-like uncharacterized protein